jgi:hypothetical protein
MTDILTYRFNGGNGDPGDVAGRIKAAVQHFYTERHRLPAAIIVNRRKLDAARDAAAALELNMPIVTCGGCHLCEVWLEVNGKGGVSL